MKSLKFRFLLPLNIIASRDLIHFRTDLILVVNLVAQFLGKYFQSRINIMKITVYFKSGAHQTFIVPRDILAVEFHRLAEEVGGSIKRIAFAEFPGAQTYLHQNQK
jgi:hypothetical protein